MGKITIARVNQSGNVQCLDDFGNYMMNLDCNGIAIDARIQGDYILVNLKNGTTRVYDMSGNVHRSF